MPAGTPTRIARGSSRRRVSRMTATALVIPTAWIERENVRATDGGTSSSFVSTGNATAPLPPGDEPPRKPPKTIISAASQWSMARPSSLCQSTKTSQPTVTESGTT